MRKADFFAPPVRTRRGGPIHAWREGLPGERIWLSGGMPTQPTGFLTAKLEILLGLRRQYRPWPGWPISMTLQGARWAETPAWRAPGSLAITTRLAIRYISCVWVFLRCVPGGFRYCGRQTTLVSHDGDSAAPRRHGTGAPASRWSLGPWTRVISGTPGRANATPSFAYKEAVGRSACPLQRRSSSAIWYGIFGVCDYRYCCSGRVLQPTRYCDCRCGLCPRPGWSGALSSK